MVLSKLYKHQQLAVNQLKTGSILCGVVGSGKTLAAIAYYFLIECGGLHNSEKTGDMLNPKDLYVITTAAKRDTLDWERECAMFSISTDRTASVSGVKLTVDSWNNIKKYTGVKDAFFIFDEQRVVGSGIWVKSFLKITKQNNWILLSATPGDNWMDYVPVFIANGFYKNRTQFIAEHVVYNNFVHFRKVDHYVNVAKLHRLKNQIMVYMNYTKSTVVHAETIFVPYDEELEALVGKKRWNPYFNQPIKGISEFCHTMRRVVNSDMSRFEAIEQILAKHKRVIIFYNFDYELDILRQLKALNQLEVAEHNGHKHEDIPKGQHWAYLVQYLSGAEGWNCIETNVIVFYSQNYSYRTMVQAAGRIDRLNTPYANLYYYTLRSNSSIDRSIAKCLENKKNFNEEKFISKKYLEGSSE